VQERAEQDAAQSDQGPWKDSELKQPVVQDDVEAMDGADDDDQGETHLERLAQGKGLSVEVSA